MAQMTIARHVLHHVHLENIYLLALATRVQKDMLAAIAKKQHVRAQNTQVAPAKALAAVV